MNLATAAYRQRHSPTFHGPYPERGDRHLCPCRCGRLLSTEWFVAITGQTPVGFVPAVERYRDPSDDATWLQEQRSVR